MFGWFRKKKEKDYIKEFEKLSAEEIRREIRNIEYEIEQALAEAKVKREELEKLLIEAAEEAASDVEIEYVANRCAMLKDEINAIYTQVQGLTNLKYVAHVMYLLKKYGVEVTRNIREDLQRMVGAKNLDELYDILLKIQRELYIESDEIERLANNLKAQVKARTTPLSKEAEKFKEIIMTLKATKDRKEREKIGKDSVREILSEK